MSSRPPRGVLLVGPPGCGKAMLASAIARRLATTSGGQGSPYPNFLRIRGPELLNKYVGEGEHQVRQIFKWAREQGRQDAPMVVFFDDLGAIFGRPGSDDSTGAISLASQLLGEVEDLGSQSGVLVIVSMGHHTSKAAAALPPSRFDVRIQIGRPDPGDATEILALHLPAGLPIASDTLAASARDRSGALAGLVEGTVSRIYERSSANVLAEVTYESGQEAHLYLSDLCSGAVIRDVAIMARHIAAARGLAGEEDGIRQSDLTDAVRDVVDEMRTRVRTAGLGFVSELVDEPITKVARP